jgi:cyclopropane-fatty-acyl-phospholipid synthase
MTVAETIAPLLAAVVGEGSRVRVEFWDGSSLGPAADDPDTPGTLRVLTPDAVSRLLWSPNELGLARAYVAGELEADGDVFALLEALRTRSQPNLRFGLSAAPLAVNAARRLGLLRRPPPPPPEEARLHGWRHTRQRDADAIGHHYDVGNDFYRLVLGPSMTYSCARFADPAMDLTEAQESKHDLICRKLGLPEQPGARLLDVGCGWGSMVIHAAARYGASAVGITISRSQADLARKRAAEAGVGDRVEIRLQDYRELGRERFDVISSIGMSEHVGAKNLVQYYAILHDALRPRGRLLNHAISSVGGSRMRRTSFIGRYVFPDGELIDVATSIEAMEQAGFEVRDVESLREHYARTLRAWVANLEERWDEAVGLVGERRARVWRLYMAGSAVGFNDGGINVHQVLGVVPTEDGDSGMPATRHAWDTPPPPSE